MRAARALPYLGAGAVLIGALVGLALRGGPSGTAGPPPAPAPEASAAPAPAPGPPDPSAYRDDPPDPDERRRVAEALVDLAERFGVLDEGRDPRSADPAEVMALLADRLRYRGPLLSDAERARLANEPGPGSARDRALALDWDARVRRFAPDRALPEGFARGPLRWQLETLAWSFHLDGGPGAPGRSAAEVPHALAEALAVDVPLRPSPLVAQFPALAAYRAFLGRLPRR